MVILTFISSNQTEKHYPDGHKEVTFSDGTIKYLHPNGVEECYFEDGTVQKVQPNGDHTIEFPNGQKEIHTKDFKVASGPISQDVCVISSLICVSQVHSVVTKCVDQN